MALIGANDMAFIGTTTWAGRPTSAAVGDMLLVSDIGPAPGSLFLWNGTRWVTTSEQVLAHTAVASPAHTGTTSKTAILSVTVPGNLLGPNGYLTFRFRSTTNNTANAKLWQLTLNTTDLFHFGPVSTTYIGGECNIDNRNSNTSQLGNPLNLFTPSASGINTLLTGTVDTTVDQSLTLNATLANAGDSMTLQAWRIMFMSRA